MQNKENMMKKKWTIRKTAKASKHKIKKKNESVMVDTENV